MQNATKAQGHATSALLTNVIPPHSPSVISARHRLLRHVWRLTVDAIIQHLFRRFVPNFHSHVDDVPDAPLTLGISPHRFRRRRQAVGEYDIAHLQRRHGEDSSSSLLYHSPCPTHCSHGYGSRPPSRFVVISWILGAVLTPSSNYPSARFLNEARVTFSLHLAFGRCNPCSSAWHGRVWCE